MHNRLELVLEDLVDGLPVGPSSMPAGMLAEFHEQIARFLKGNHKDVEIDAVRVAIEAGSYKVIVPMVAMIAGMSMDVAMLGNGNLDDMDSKRAMVVEEWQKAARLRGTRRYRIGGDGMHPVQIYSGSNYTRHDSAVWVNVERYLKGYVTDLGGKKPNLHLQMADGTSVIGVGRGAAGSCMMTAFLLDTSFLITLVDDRRIWHLVARQYFENALASGAVMYVSTLALAEFSIKQAVTDLPLHTLRVLPFNIDHAIAAGPLASNLMPARDPGDERGTVRTDLNLIAQANAERIPYILTEDRKTLAKYLDRARSSGTSMCRAVILADGFDARWFSDGQSTFEFKT